MELLKESESYLKESESYFKSAYSEFLLYKDKVDSIKISLNHYKKSLVESKNELMLHRFNKPHKLHRWFNTKNYKDWFYKENVIIADCNRYSNDFDMKIKELTALR